MSEISATPRDSFHEIKYRESIIETMNSIISEEDEFLNVLKEDVESIEK